MLSTATSIVLTLLLVWAAATATIVGGVTFVRRFRSSPQVLRYLARDERQEEVRWAAIRFLGHGLDGERLQEAVCQETNCTPAEATYAIAQASKPRRSIDEPPRS